MQVLLHVASAIASNFRPFARVLASSLRARHPAARLTVLVVDDDSPEDAFDVVGAATLVGARELRRRALMYDTQALISSLKGALLAHLLERDGGPVLLLDADVLVLGDLEPVAERAARDEVLLSPHVMEPGRREDEEVFLRAGAFNGGFVGVAGRRGLAFARWWDDRCARHCVRDERRRLLLSQTWLDLAPALFGAAVLRDPGANVMGHNLGDRDLGDIAEPRWFHFTGFDPGTPQRLGARTERSWRDLDGKPGVAALAASYAQALRDAGWRPDPPAPGFTAFADGTGVTPPMRAAYRDGLLRDEEPPNPFAGDEISAFLDWLAAPAGDHPWFTRYLAGLHTARADLRRAWPAVPGEHLEPYLAWCYVELAAQDPAFAEVERRRQVRAS